MKQYEWIRKSKAVNELNTVLNNLEEKNNSYSKKEKRIEKVKVELNKKLKNVANEY